MPRARILGFASGRPGEIADFASGDVLSNLVGDVLLPPTHAATESASLDHAVPSTAVIRARQRRLVSHSLDTCTG